jgi:hypothetical protein
MCYIVCMTSINCCYIAPSTRWGLRGAVELPFRGLQWVYSPLAWGFRGSATKKCFGLGKRVSFFCLIFHVHCWVIFRHMVFADGFLFPVKELGFLTNPGHWVRVLDVAWLLYVYCIVNNV